MLDTINKISYCGICHGKMMMAIEEEAAKAQSASTSTTASTEASTKTKPAATRSEIVEYVLSLDDYGPRKGSRVLAAALGRNS